MNGYAGTLRELAEGYGISVQQTPPARADALHRYLKDRIAEVDRALPAGVLPRDQEFHRALMVGILAQITGLTDFSSVHVARVEEQTLATLEHLGRCYDRESNLRHIVVTDRRYDTDLFPTVLVAPLVELAEELFHAKSIHLPHFRKHVGHCPSFQTEIDAVKSFGDAIPAAILLLVGDSKDGPRQVAYGILTGETPSLKNGY